MKNSKHFWLITIALLTFSNLAATAQTEKSELLNKSDSLYAVAFNLYKTGKYNEAIPLFSESYGLDTIIYPPKHVRREHSLRQAARCYYMLGDTVMAYSMSPTCVTEQPDRRLTVKSDSLIMLCKEYTSQKKYEEALEILSKAQATMKKSIGTKTFLYANLLENKMPIYIQTGNADKFIECLNEIEQVRAISLGKTNLQYIATIENIGLAYELFKKDYDKAAEYYEIATNLNKNNSDKTKLIKSLTRLGDAYIFGNHYEKSLEAYLEAYEVIKKNGLENDICNTFILSGITKNYNNLGKYALSLEYAIKNAEVSKMIYGEKSKEYANILNNIGVIHNDLHNPDKSIEYITEGLAIYKELNGETLPIVASLELSLGNAYNDKEDIESAIEHYQKSLEISKINDLENSFTTADALSNLANVYCKKSEFRKAYANYTQAYKIYRDNIKTCDIVKFIRLQNNLSTVLIDVGKYDEAMSMLNSCLEMSRKYLDKNSPSYSSTLTNTAIVYQDLGNFQKSLELFNESAKIKKNIYGEYDYKYAEALNNVGTAYNYLRDNQNAYKTLTHTLEIYDKLIKDSIISLPIGYSNTLNNLGIYYEHIADYGKAMDCFVRSSEISKKLAGENSLEYIRSLGNLTNTYAKQRALQSALANSIKICELIKKLYNTANNILYASSIRQQGDIYNELKDSTNAIRCYTKSLEIYGKELGTDHYEYGTTLMNIGIYYHDNGNLGKALEYETQGLKTIKEKMGDRHPMSIYSMENIANLYFDMGETEKALSEAEKAMSASKQNLISNFSFMTANERETYWDYNNHIYNSIIKLSAITPDDTTGFTASYDAELITKGLLLASEINFTNIIMESGDYSLISDYENLKTMHFILNKELEKPINERSYNCDSLDSRIQNLEKQIVERSKEYGNIANTISINWKNVQDSLKANDVAIEFTNYKQNDTIKYVALVLTKDMETPKLVPLFEQSEIQKMLRGITPIKTDTQSDYENRGATLVSAKRQGIYETTNLYESLWKPLEKYFTEKPRIYFAPSGMLHQIAVEYAPIDHSKTISDKYEIYRVSSTRFLTMDYMPTTLKESVLYGGIFYDSDTATMKQQSNRYSTRSANMNSFADLNKNEERGSLSYLPGTKTEVDNIVGKLKKKKVKTTFYEGSAANEESFKALSGKSISTLHIATHGFFLPTDEKLSGDNSLIQSGLLMSGANYAWQNLPIPEGVEDGVLTAKEISYMDLRRTDLVVLSACQTALGEITGEGVFGLQRGFKKAGARTIIMSLWPVDDNATLLMMTEFYTNLTKGMSKREAFLNAQNKVKTTTGFENPRYWAAFIMLDGNE